MIATVRIAWRETRAAWRRLLPLLLCLAIGVGAVVMVGSFSASVRATIAERTRGLLAADLQISSSAPLDRSVFPTIASLETEGGSTTTITEFLSVVVAGADATESLLCEVKAVGDSYPLVGALTLQDGTTASPPRGNDVLVEASLLSRLRVEVGDSLTLGTVRVRIAGVIAKEPDRSLSAITLGPRILMDEAILPSTGLLERGSRATYRIAIRLPVGRSAADVKASLIAEAKETTATIRTAEEAQSAVGRAVDRLDHTLVTVALAILLLAGTGIALTVRLHVLQRLDMLAILRAIGATRGQLSGVVLLQALGLGALGSLVGVVLGLLGQTILPRIVARLLPDNFISLISWESAIEGVALGLATTLAFALAPSLLASRVSPLTVLRRSPTPLVLPRRPTELLLILGAVAMFVVVLIRTTGSWQAGVALIGIIVALVLVLQLLSHGLFRLLRVLAARTKSFVLREGLLHPTRSMRATSTVVTTLTLGGLLIGTVGLVERNLIDSLGTSLAEERPNVYVIGIRAEQRALVTETVGMPVAFEPVVRARVYAVDGRKIERNQQSAENGQGGAAREFGVTMRDAIGPDEEVTSGAFWTTPPSTSEVSVEEEIMRELGAQIGSQITFDILGTRVNATATSVRKVDWETGRPNYVFVLSPGVLDEAPTTYFVALKVPPDAVAGLQTRLAKAVPNASTFDASAALAIVSDVLGQIVSVVEFLASLVVLVGLVLLGGMVLSTRAARVRETAILLTVGAKARHIRRMLVVEYGILGLTSGVLAAGLAEIASWWVVTRLLEQSWAPFLGPVTLGVSVFVLLAVGVGVLAARPILRAAPLQTLREG